MFSTLKSRAARATAAATIGVTLAGALLPAAAVAAPVIDTNWPAPTQNEAPDPFYTPPATLPAGEPGDIIRARPSAAGPPTARSLASAWQVMYLSTDARGARDVVTGTVLVPRGANPSTTPVLAIAPGTTGPAFRCTVSRWINSGGFYEQPAVNDALKAGYAVAVTDYEGYRENARTTYIAGASMGHAVLDAVRAATRLPDAGLSSNPKVMLRGYSQGGGATMWASQMAQTYAPELNVIGAAAGGVPADIARIAVFNDEQDGAGFLLNALIGLGNAYPDLLLDSYLTDEGRQTLSNMNENDCTLELLLDYQGASMLDSLSSSPFVTSPWLARIKENKLGAVKVPFPVFQYHGTDDNIVEYDQALTLRNAYCKLGVNETWKTYPVDHVTGVARGNPDVMAFLADRVAGAPATSNCGA